MADRDQLSIVVEAHEDRTVVRLRGELDLATAPTVVDSLRRTSGEVVIDLVGLAFIDASGLRVLVEAGRHLEDHGGGLVVINATGLTQRMFELTGLDHLLSGSDAL